LRRRSCALLAASAGGSRGPPPQAQPTLADAVRHLILPALALATIPLAVIARMTRASMLEVLSREYIRTAEAKLAGLRNSLFAISLVSIPAYARLSRGSVLALREQEFVMAAQDLGYSGWRELLGQIVPNSLPR
jgi:ABC-type dipeptide/oligopeptide/nickel transport system permease component